MTDYKEREKAKNTLGTKAGINIHTYTYIHVHIYA